MFFSHFASSLLFVCIPLHLSPDAAGGSIFDVLKEIKPKTLLRRDVKAMHISMVESETINKSYFRIHEFDKLRTEDSEKGFVISSMREPCSHYLSLWSYGSTKTGGLFWDMMKNDRNWTLSAYGKNAPLFDSDEDIVSFRDIWLKDEKIHGLLAQRFHRSYGNEKLGNFDSPPDQVDCWIFVENFQESLVTCLKQYEREGGYVMWEAPLLSKMLQQLEEKNHRILYVKNNALGFGETNPQNSHHSKCSKYFDDSTAHAIETGPESFIYTMFGYEGCCKTGRQKIGSEAYIAEDTKSNDMTRDAMSVEDNNTISQGNVKFILLHNDTNVSNQGDDGNLLETMKNESILTFIKIQTVLVFFFIAAIIVKSMKKNLHTLMKPKARGQKL